MQFHVYKYCNFFATKIKIEWGMNNVTSSFSQSIHKREDFKRFKINDKLKISHPIKKCHLFKKLPF